MVRTLKGSTRVSHPTPKSSLTTSPMKRTPDGTVYSYITDIPRSPSLGNRPFTMTQNVLVLNWFSTSVTLPTFTFIDFVASQIDQFNDLAAVFDQYRVNEVEVFITNQASNLNIQNTGRLITVLDYDDSNNLTTLGQAEDYTTAVTSSCQSSQYRRLVPRMALAAYSGTLFNSFANIAPQWIDSASTAVKHYGVKLAASVTSSVMVFDLQIKYNISFRQVR